MQTATNLSKTKDRPSRQGPGMYGNDVHELSGTVSVLVERLQAWKHAVSYLEEYVGAVEKIHRSESKEYEHILKVPQRTSSRKISHRS